MKETIYTIPVSEAFERQEGCPICALADMLEKKEIDAITGASMMEPDVRQATNELGFCGRHFRQMYAMQKKLPLGLLLETRCAEVEKRLARLPGQKPKQALPAIREVNETCYVCHRMELFLGQIIGTIFHLWKKEPDFRENFMAQHFCMRHFELLCDSAGKHLLPPAQAEFTRLLCEKQLADLRELRGDVSWFCQKFDYRNRGADWKNSADAVERSILFFTGEDVRRPE